MNTKLGIPAKVFVALAFLFLYLPILVIVVYSFNSNPSANSADFQGFTTLWYTQIIGDYSTIKALVTSLEVAVGSVVVSLIIGIPAGVVLAKTNFPGRRLFDSITLLPLLLPEVVLGLAFMSFYALLGIPFGNISLVVAHTTFCLPYVIILVSTRLVGADPNLAEAARDLGANWWQTFLTATLPVIVPAIASAAVLSFALSFDDVIISYFTAGASSGTLPMLIYSQVKLHPMPSMKALCSLIILVSVALVFLFYVVKLALQKKSERRQKKALKAPRIFEKKKDSSSLRGASGASGVPAPALLKAFSARKSEGS